MAISLKYVESCTTKPLLGPQKKLQRHLKSNPNPDPSNFRQIQRVFLAMQKNSPSNLMWFSLAASENGMYVYIYIISIYYIYVHIYVYIYIYFLIHDLNSKNFDLLNSSKTKSGWIFTHAKNSQKSSSNKKYIHTRYSNQRDSGWWFQPNLKILVNLDHFPK